MDTRKLDELIEKLESQLKQVRENPKPTEDDSLWNSPAAKAYTKWAYELLDSKPLTLEEKKFLERFIMREPKFNLSTRIKFRKIAYSYGNFLYYPGRAVILKIKEHNRRSYLSIT